MSEGTEFEMYDGRKVRPMLERLAKENNKTYEQAKKAFIDKIAKGSVKRFQDILDNMDWDKHSRERIRMVFRLCTRLCTKKGCVMLYEN